MTRMEIIVREKRARLAKSVRYVCGNSDYIASFTFDEEWDDIPVKTARFQRGAQHIDVVFEGTECPVPVFFDGTSMEIGVYAGTDAEAAVLYSTTSALVGMDKSIRGHSEAQEPPMPGVYDQLIALLNDTADTTLGARDQVVQMAEEVSAAVETAAGYVSGMHASVERAEMAAGLAEDAKAETTAAAAAAEASKKEAVDAQGGAQAARTSAEAAAESAKTALAAAMKASVYDPRGYYEDIFSYVDMRLGRKVYGVLWDKANAKCTRLFDAAGLPTDTTTFGHFGAENPDYANPFDSIYPWSERKLCNYSIAAFQEISDTEGYDVRDAVVAWEGEAAFRYDPAPGLGVGVYTPRFWHTSYDTDQGRVFAVSGTRVPGWTEAEATIGGRWFGTVEELDMGGETTTVLGCRPGIPATAIAVSALHTYAKNGGMTLEDVWSMDAETVLMVVEYANMNAQNAVGQGCDSLYRRASDKVQAAAENTNVIKVLAAMADYCVPGAVLRLGTTNGGRTIGSGIIVSVEADPDNADLLNVTFAGAPVTVTTNTYWSINGCANMEDESIGSHSGYLGTNGKCNAYYRGRVVHANLWRYVLGAYRQTGTGHIWIAESRAQAENYDGLDTAAHIDTGIVLPQGTNGAAKEGYIKNLAAAPGLSIPPFCDQTGGSSAKPVGDYYYVPSLATGNSILLMGGYAYYGADNGRFYSNWYYSASSKNWNFAGVPFSRSR